MQVAIVSTDGINVNEHFGRADRFLIYEIDSTHSTLLAAPKAEPLSVGDPDHPFDKARFDAVLKALSGCKRVYCTRIGERPTAELKKNGIEPVIFQGSITEININDPA
jgi:predicted Fe-Mo cluster-binding NifX family protein